MPCVLTRQANGVFVGQAGRTAEIGLRSAQPGRVVRLIYAGTEDGQPPFTFTIKPGLNKLLVVAVGVSAGVQHMSVVEDPNGAACHLKNFFWSPTHFFTTLDINGI